MNFSRINAPAPIELTEVTKGYGELQVLDGISFRLKRGEILSLLGPSGCGKSTLMHLIAGLEVPDSGRILIGGEAVCGKPGRVGYMHQKDLLLPWKRVIENVCVPLRLKGVGRAAAEKHARPLFKPFGLDGFEEYYPAQLSGGMQQRAALMRTYLYRRDILLLDEPFGALDAITRERLQDWLLTLIGTLETSALLVTHDIDEAILLSDRVLVMSEKPAQITAELEIHLARPRRRETALSEEFVELKRRLYAHLRA